MLARPRRTQNLATATRFLWPIPDRGLRKRLHRVTSLTLMVWGDDDPIVSPVYGDRFRDLLPNAHVTVIQCFGHLPMLERPERCAEAVAAFLAD